MGICGADSARGGEYFSRKCNGDPAIDVQNAGGGSGKIWFQDPWGRVFRGQHQGAVFQGRLDEFWGSQKVAGAKTIFGV